MEIKEIQNELLKLMIAFNDICIENDIQYSLHGGTLLGAVREKGFIPWDDDIDIAMTRDNYERLRVILGGYVEYHIVGNIKKQFKGVKNENFWIDIFICDYITDNKLFRSIKLTSLTILDFMCRDKETIKLCNFSIYSTKKRILCKCAYYFGKLFPKRLKINLYEWFSKFGFLGNKKLMTRSNDQFKGRKELFPSNWMTSYLTVKFETATLPIIKEYHQMLIKSYGENYLTPIKEVRNNEIHDMIRAEGEIRI